MGLFDVFRSKKEIALQQEIDNLKRKQDVKVLSEFFRMDNPEVTEDVVENAPYARVFPTDNGYQYEIIVGGVVAIKQDCKPDEDGFVPMSEGEATAYSNEIANRMRGLS